MKLLKTILFIILVGIFFEIGEPIRPVAAQEPVLVSIRPATGYLDLNVSNKTTVQVYIENVVDFNSFEITLNYDPAIISLSSYTFGGLFPQYWELLIANDPGLLHIVFVKLGSPGYTGEGVLLYLNFQAVTPGISALTLAEVKLTKLNGDRIYPVIQSGLLKVGTFYTVSGSFGLEGRSERGGIQITLEQGALYNDGPYHGETLDQLGVNLSFSNVMGDTYVITTAQPRCLNLTIELNKSVNVSSSYIMRPLKLRCGNAIWTDNVIDISDAGVVGGQWGMTQADLEEGETLNGDVNFDNIVNIRDLALVAGNYDLSSEAVYADWTP